MSDETAVRTKLHNHTAKSQAARAAIAARFAAAQETTQTASEGPLSFPAFLALRSIRINPDNSLSATFNIPAQFLAEVFVPLTAYCDEPLAVVIEKMSLDD